MKNLLVFALMLPLFFSACDNTAESTSDNSTPEPEIPKEEAIQPEEVTLYKISLGATYEVLAEAEGDLDKDGIAEKVVIYDTGEEGEMGDERELQVHKKRDGEWKLWFKTRGPVLGSQSGGMMGDPFDDLAIERSCIVIRHFGGSANKWAYTHRFRYQNEDWELIGATVNTIYFYQSEEFDYNLSNGGVVYTAKDEDPEKNVEDVVEKFTSRLDAPIKLTGFVPGDREMKIPGVGKTMYY